MAFTTHTWDDQPERRAANHGAGLCNTGAEAPRVCELGGIGCDVAHDEVRKIAAALAAPAPDVGPRSPDLTRKVRGYRAFTLSRQGELGSVFTRNVWMPGPNQARCDARELAAGGRGLIFPPPTVSERHEAPAPGCMCGLYAMHDQPAGWEAGDLKGGPIPSGPMSAMTFADMAVTVGAIVTAWGHLEVHRNGFRAEWAEIVALVHDPYDGPVARAQAERAADLYRVPLVPVTELANHPVLELADRVPDQLLPEPEPSYEFENASGMLSIPLYGVGPGLRQPGPVATGGFVGISQPITHRITLPSVSMLQPGVHRAPAGTSISMALPLVSRRQRDLRAVHIALAVNTALGGWNTIDLATDLPTVHPLTVAAVAVALVAVAVLIRLRRKICAHYAQD